MNEVPVLVLGGLVCGGLAGAAAQYGRLCTFAAIEDAVVAHDYRRARAFVVALATALFSTQALQAAGILDLSTNPYAQPRIELAGLVIGAFLFGTGMSLVGTCGFGLLVRLGTGDLRALVSAATLGISAAAATGGVLAPPRLMVTESFVVPAPASVPALAGSSGPYSGLLLATILSLLLIGGALASRRFRRRIPLLLAGLLLGCAVAGGWLVTGALADPFGVHRLESLSFVAPLARILQLVMGEQLSSAHFATMTVIGAVIGSFIVARWREELRWEAFDDQREMRRHLLGAALMGFGGVLARGCTIGQGLSAASTLSITAPIAIACMILGARLGLYYLIEGRTLLPRWGKL